MKRIRRGTLLFATLLAATACDSKKKDDGEAKADAAKPAETKTDETEVAEGDDGADEATPEGEKSEEEKKAERVERVKKEFAALAEWEAKEKERWNDEVVEGVKKLVTADYTNAEAKVDAILASAHRHPDNVKRDAFRHPKATLAFFGLQPTMTIVEVGPGRGWYTELLAPFVAGKGKLVVNSPNPEGADDDTSRIYGKRIASFLASSADAYGGVEVLVAPDKDTFELGEPNTADAVLVIRGLHGAVGSGKLDERLAEIHSVLKDGGTFGVVQHRAKAGVDPEESSKSGYLPEAWLVEQIEAAGFKLEAKSEINANPKDTTDYPEGVWTLPPSLALGDEDKDKYEAIGESDRMTLKFVKVAKADDTGDAEGDGTDEADADEPAE